MKAYYDLSVKPATFDFVTFSVIAKTLGAESVVFDVSKGFQRKKFSQDIARQMYEKVLKPVCELWGLGHSEGTSGDFTPGYFHTDAIATFEHMGFLAKPVVAGLDGRDTVTIRDSIRNTHRNSNRAAWERFSSEDGCYFIDDAYKVPMPLLWRMRLYSGSRMNWFCSNGPGMLCVYSDAPYTFFSPPCADSTWPEGIGPGFQFPWANKNQRIVWADDTYENIVRERDRHAV